MCIYNQSIKKDQNSLFNALLPARHMFLMMGFFAFYNGFIYNEYISISLNLFGSCYTEESKYLRVEGCVYPFGIDPVWGAASNQLTFVNSYKMKLSVLVAVVHMCFGILMKGFNAVYFKNKLDFWFEFVPQIAFMLATFGWMDFMVVYKWLTPFPDTDKAPSIITLMIGMILQPFEVPDPALFNDAGL